jgi:hypothetical protein
VNLDDSATVRNCFILGVTRRSGTNFLNRLLRYHQHTAYPEPIWEDYFLHHSDGLLKYLEDVSGDHSDHWVEDIKPLPRELLLEGFGDAICRYLRKQASITQDARMECTGRSTEIQVVLSKTPSVGSIANFFALFPRERLVVITRDGRASVESMVASWDTPYEDSMRHWAARADELADFLEVHGQDPRLLLVRYEDLVSETNAQIRRLLAFLDLSEDSFHWEKAASLGILGSSEVVKKSGELHWEEQAKTRDFDPLKRAAHWGAERHAQFNEIAGKAQRRLGYSLQKG